MRKDEVILLSSVVNNCTVWGQLRNEVCVRNNKRRRRSWTGVFFSPQGCRLQSEKSFRRGHGQMGQIILRLTCIVCYSFLYLQRNGFVWEIWVRKLKMTKWVNKKSPSETASGSWWASTQKNWISFSRTESLPHAPINYIWMQFTVQASANPSFRQLFLNSDSSIWQTGGGKCTPRFMASLSGEHFISQAVMSSFVLTLTPSIP